MSNWDNNYQLRISIPTTINLGLSELIILLKQEKEKFLGSWDDIVERDGKMIFYRYGTGSHHYSWDDKGPEATSEQLHYFKTINEMIKLLEEKQSGKK